LKFKTYLGHRFTVGYLDFQRKIQKDRATDYINQAGANLEKKGTPKQLVYPQDLFSPECAPFILFFAVDPTKPDVLLDKIALYMPRNIEVNYGINYSEATNYLKYLSSNSLAGLGELASDPLYGGAAAFGAIRGAIGAAMAGGSVAGKISGAALGAIASGLNAFKASNAIGQTASINSKKTLNPHKAALFEGVNFRRHNFQFDLIARNEEESETIREILQTFKIHAHPDAGNPDDQSSVFYWPSAWQIALYSPARKYLYAISTSHITNIAINYTGGGTRAFFADTGAPVVVRLNVDFMETEQLTRERIRQGF
jgi:hypothetical protein